MTSKKIPKHSWRERRDLDSLVWLYANREIRGTSTPNHRVEEQGLIGKCITSGKGKTGNGKNLEKMEKTSIFLLCMAWQLYESLGRKTDERWTNMICPWAYHIISSFTGPMVCKTCWGILSSWADWGGMYCKVCQILQAVRCTRRKRFTPYCRWQLDETETRNPCGRLYCDEVSCQ